MGNETECEHFTWRLKVLYKVHRGGEETGERGAYSQSYGFLLRRRGRKITIFFARWQKGRCPGASEPFYADFHPHEWGAHGMAEGGKCGFGKLGSSLIHIILYPLVRSWDLVSLN